MTGSFPLIALFDTQTEVTNDAVEDALGVSTEARLGIWKSLSKRAKSRKSAERAALFPIA